MVEVPLVIELLANLSTEERLMVLRHFHDDLAALTRESHLPGGGMATGTMVLTEPASERETQTDKPARSGATPMYP